MIEEWLMFWKSKYHYDADCADLAIRVETTDLKSALAIRECEKRPLAFNNFWDSQRQHDYWEQPQMWPKTPTLATPCKSLMVYLPPLITRRHMRLSSSSPFTSVTTAKLLYWSNSSEMSNLLPDSELQHHRSEFKEYHCYRQPIRGYPFVQLFLNTHFIVNHSEIAWNSFNFRRYVNLHSYLQSRFKHNTIISYRLAVISFCNSNISHVILYFTENVPIPKTNSFMHVINDLNQSEIAISNHLVVGDASSIAALITQINTTIHSFIHSARLNPDSPSVCCIT